MVLDLPDSEQFALGNLAAAPIETSRFPVAPKISEGGEAHEI
jgi:hypothetical protein